MSINGKRRNVVCPKERLDRCIERDDINLRAIGLLTGVI